MTPERKAPAGGSTRLRARAGKVAGVAAFTLLLLEISLRLCFVVGGDGWSLNADDLLARRYPPCEEILAGEPDLGSYRILLLGASSFHPNFGTVGARLAEAYRERGVEAEIDNPSEPALSTRDNFFQFEILANRNYDAVVIYQGINDARANNCPDEVYQDDYSHYAWYDDLNTAYRHRASLPFLVTPYAVDLILHDLRQKLFGRKRYQAIDNAPKDEWVAFGATLKTPPAFRTNLERILGTARKHGTKVILATFAYSLPEDYSLEAFKAGELDYGLHAYPVELWGAPTNVVAAMDAHNQVLRELATEYDLSLLEADRIIPPGKLHFDDVCHLTDEGSRLLAQALARMTHP